MATANSQDRPDASLGVLQVHSEGLPDCMNVQSDSKRYTREYGGLHSGMATFPVAATLRFSKPLSLAMLLSALFGHVVH